MIKNYIKNKIIKYVNIITKEVTEETAREISQTVARDVAKETAREINFVNSEQFKKLTAISFELQKKINFILSRDKINPWECYRNKQFGFWFGDFHEVIKEKEPIPNVFCEGLNCVIGARPIKMNPTGDNLDDIDILLLWGQASYEEHINVIYNALLKQRKIIYAEDGFFYNVISYVKSLKDEYPSCLTKGMSFTIDDITAHFDGSMESRLEQAINSDIILEDEKLLRSKNLIEKIVKNKLTKYNYQSMESKSYGNKNSKVLIVDQAYGDYSVFKSGASEEVFHQMLDDAIKENPESDILIKIHPDMITDPNRGNAKNGGYFSSMQINHPNVIVIKDEINPYILIEQVDSIYVCTSQLGFEGLMSQKKVYCYGVPFYSGWGITIDRGNNEYLKRRVKKRSIEEVFWFAYIWYSRYYSPCNKCACEIEDVLEELILNRESFNKQGIIC